MSPTLALVILSWVAIVVLYLGLAAVLREVRLLRRQLAERQAAGTGLDEVRLPAGFAAHIAIPGQDRTVLVADSGCPLCRHAVAMLGEAVGAPSRPVLLSYESTEQWTGLPDTVEFVQDREAWSTLAHLSPPMLLTVGSDGKVGSLVLPTTEQDLARALNLPSPLATTGRSSS